MELLSRELLRLILTPQALSVSMKGCGRIYRHRPIREPTLFRYGDSFIFTAHPQKNRWLGYSILETSLKDTTLLELKDVTARYGDVQILWGVSFSVREGEIATLVGANGAGKTTTLKTISGVVSATAGRISFNGERIERRAPHEIAARGIAHVPEGRRLFPLMSVRENLELGAVSEEARRLRKESFDRVFDLFPRVRERERQMAGTLSGGEQQMVAIGRGLMARPRLVILDEPSLGLAPIVVKEMFEIIQSINREGITILLVEQNVQQSLKLADRAYVLENGRVVLEGAGSELLNDERVRAAYLGA
jgi:branched-chain amino acid transport system ATP-binding protein